MSNLRRMTIDIYSDVMCPWCLIGYGQLTKALEELDGEIAAQLRWHPFELNPDIIQEGEGQEQHLQRKYGRPASEGAAIRTRMREIAGEAGVSIDYQGQGEAPPAMMWNTFAAHCLLTWTLQNKGADKQTELKLALFRAHFNERRNISSRDVLVDIAASVGIDRSDALSALADPAIAQRVREEEGVAYDMNITGVPAMIVDGKFMIPGAQAPEVYVNALRRVAEKSAA